ncbi:flagellar biosynthesis protein FliO [Ancylobacter aquaticus]|uniref:Flagellar biosynthesis protein FliO n=1 Tax=Ancylobacter aquaticus TaxID=100 RepID=A0A4R1I0Q8_ANCAQ|nr:flagellar biosynthetic protein FliO [Ancylobacter aquaticus]TCK28727.1 flagellar biosynthesis protein FliO [Ancylobacter aquaticus]
MMDVLADLGSLTVPILAFIGLIVLAGLVVWLGRRARRNRSHGLVAGHRLAVIDHIQIDETRRLVLIQRDDVQHLVVLGGGSDFLVESGIGAIPARAQQHPHAPPREFEPPRAPEPAAAHDSLRAGEPARPTPPRAEPLREPPRNLRDVPPPPPASRPQRPIPLPPEARTPVEPRPTMVSRGPARDIPVEPMALAPAPMAPAPILAAPPFARRSAEPHRAEPVIAGPSEPESGARVTVKVDPLFAGMADHLEEALRRPALPEGEAGRQSDPSLPPPAITSPAFERALERAIDRPAAPPRGAEGRRMEEPGRPAGPPAASSTPIVVAPPAAGPAPVLGPPPVLASPALHAGGPGSERPSAPLPDAPAPEIRMDVSPPESLSTGPAAPPIRAIDMFAPERDLPAATDEPQPTEPADLFEEEMANLLGRNRRP